MPERFFEHARRYQLFFFPVAILAQALVMQAQASLFRFWHPFPALPLLGSPRGWATWGLLVVGGFGLDADAGGAGMVVVPSGVLHQCLLLLCRGRACRRDRGDHSADPVGSSSSIGNDTCHASASLPSSSVLGLLRLRGHGASALGSLHGLVSLLGSSRVATMTCRCSWVEAAAKTSRYGGRRALPRGWATCCRSDLARIGSWNSSACLHPLSPLGR